MSETQEIKLVGYFKIDDIDNIPGTLFVSKDGDISLELFTSFEIGKDFLDSNKKDIPIITGQVEKKGYITLIDNFFTSKSIDIGADLNKFTVVSKYAYMGVVFESNNILLDTFTFDLDGFGEWLGKYTIHTDHSIEDNTLSVQSKLSGDSHIYSLIEDYSLTFKISHSGNMADSITNKATITQNISLQLSTQTQKSLQDFIYISYKLINFFSFAISETLNIQNVRVTNNGLTREIYGKEYPIDIDVIYKSTNISKQNTSFHPHNMLFCFHDIEKTFESKIQSWFTNYQKIEPTMNLYFAVKKDTHSYIESKFLFLIQALETYHRRVSNEKYMDDIQFQSLYKSIIKSIPKEHKEWIEGKLKFGNEISLRTRIKKILEPFNDLIGSSKERKSLVGKIVDTRNYLTHYNEDLKANAVSGFNLIELNKKLEGLLELLLLNELEFSKEEIDNIFKEIIMKKFKN